MADAQKPLTPSAIKYLLTLLELCQKDAGARCMDIAEQLRVTKPSVHSMIENLCAAGLAEKKKYGTVFLTPEGRIYFNEVNTIPGFTSHSRYPNMLKEIGLSFTEIIQRLLETGVSI